MEFDRVDCFGKISVRIPRSWIESDDEEDTTCGFYDPHGESGALRVSLITRTRLKPVSVAMLQEEDFEDRSEEGVRFFLVGDEYTVAEWEKPAEHEVDTYIYWWTLSAVTGSLMTRRALFSYAVPLDFKGRPDFAEHLEMVRDCVFATHFSPEQAV